MFRRLGSLVHTHQVNIANLWLPCVINYVKEPCTLTIATHNDDFKEMFCQLILFHDTRQTDTVASIFLQVRVFLVVGILAYSPPPTHSYMFWCLAPRKQSTGHVRFLYSFPTGVTLSVCCFFSAIRIGFFYWCLALRLASYIMHL